MTDIIAIRPDIVNYCKRNIDICFLKSRSALNWKRLLQASLALDAGQIDGAPSPKAGDTGSGIARAQEEERKMSGKLAERIDCLFRNHPSPRNREYTYREVASTVSAQNGDKLSPSYVWQLRTGVKENPSMRHIEALARFFGVSPSYFFDSELTELPESELRLLATSKNGLLRPIAVSMLGLSEESLCTIRQLASRLRQLEGVPRPEEDAGRITRLVT